MKIYYLMLLFFPLITYAQLGRVEHESELNRKLSRLEIKQSDFIDFFGQSPVYKDKFIAYIDTLNKQELSSEDLKDIEWIKNQLFGYTGSDLKGIRGWKSYFYRNKSSALSLRKDKIWLSANPILYLRSGYENEDNIILQNTRGVCIEGKLGKSMYFTSRVLENQTSFRRYHRKTIERNQAIPGYAFFKDFNFNIPNKAYDYLVATGHMGLKLNTFMSAELGHGKHFIGYGKRSLLLSDYASNYFYLRLNTSFWRIKYQNLFAELLPFTDEVIQGDKLIPKKFMAQHVLSFKVSESFQLGLVETVILHRPKQFELQYLNPVIFYRAVEQLLGSPDNVIMGIQAKWNIGLLQVYGQFVMDEFNLNQLREDLNWFGNTVGAQLGIKRINLFGVDHLDVQFECNAVRPFVYSHRDSYKDTNLTLSSFSHFSQPLAHPLGANFLELLMDLEIPISSKFKITPRYIFAQQGVQSTDEVGEEGFNTGYDILLDRNTMHSRGGHFFLKGEPLSINQLWINSSYEVFHNMFVELRLHYRNAVSKNLDFADESYFAGLAFRMNFSEQQRDY